MEMYQEDSVEIGTPPVAEQVKYMDVAGDNISGPALSAENKEK